MPVRTANGVLRTDAIETPIIEQRAMATTEAEDPWHEWNAWMDGHKNLLKQEIAEAVGFVFSELRHKQKQLQELVDDVHRLAADVSAVTMRDGTTTYFGKQPKSVPGSFNVKGAFDPNAIYNRHDVVMLNGSSWIALRDSPGSLPGDGWRLLACAGRRGPKGERGTSSVYALELEGDVLILRAIGSHAPLRLNLRPLIERVIAETRGNT
jgi:hypothetical protein